MKVGDLVKRIKNSPSHGDELLGVVLGIVHNDTWEDKGDHRAGTILARVFYFEVDSEFWEQLDWLEVINEK